MFSGYRSCRICGTYAFVFFEENRSFFLCKNCGLIFSNCLLTCEERKKHYQNQYEIAYNWDQEAIAILDLVKFAAQPNKILDFGSGSGQLASTFRGMGLDVDTYEPLVDGELNIESYCSGYDLVVVNEVIEHIDNIVEVISWLGSVTRVGGVIYIGTVMTDAIINESDKFKESFNSWWYKNDPTHISFFCQLTFEYICSIINNCRLKMVAIGSNGVLLQRE